jgi:hypothetical protein
VGSETVSKWFAARADLILGTLWAADFAQLSAAVDQLEAELSSRHVSTSVSGEYKRRLLELRMIAAVKKDQGPGLCREILQRRVRAGFRSVNDDATAVCTVAAYCERHGDVDGAVRTVLAFRRRLQRRTGTRRIAAELAGALDGIVERNRRRSSAR